MLATETISPNGQKIEAASLWFLKEKCFKAHSPLWSKWNKAFSDTYKASWKQHQHIAAFISFIRIFSQTGSFLPWLCYTAFCVDTNISASFAWWFRDSVQAGKGAQVPCSSIPLFLHTVIIAEIKHSFCSMLLLPKKEPRGSKANHSSLQDELPGCCLARWWSLATEGAEKGCALHVSTEGMWTWCPGSTSSPAKQSWRNKEQSDSYSASLPLFQLLNAPKF